PFGTHRESADVTLPGIFVMFRILEIGLHIRAEGDAAALAFFFLGVRSRPNLPALRYWAPGGLVMRTLPASGILSDGVPLDSPHLLLVNVSCSAGETYGPAARLELTRFGGDLSSAEGRRSPCPGHVNHTRLNFGSGSWNSCAAGRRPRSSRASSSPRR